MKSSPFSVGRASTDIVGSFSLEFSLSLSLCSSFQHLLAVYSLSFRSSNSCFFIKIKMHTNESSKGLF